MKKLKVDVTQEYFCNFYMGDSIEKNVAQYISVAVDNVRDAFLKGKTRPLSWRREQLDGIERFIKENEEDILDALYKDLGKPRIEAVCSEVIFRGVIKSFWGISLP